MNRLALIILAVLATAVFLHESKLTTAASAPPRLFAKFAPCNSRSRVQFREYTGVSHLSADAKRKRLFVSALGVRTGYFFRKRDRFYVAVPAKGNEPAQVWTYEAQD